MTAAARMLTRCIAALAVAACVFAPNATRRERPASIEVLPELRLWHEIRVFPTPEPEFEVIFFDWETPLRIERNRPDRLGPPGGR